MKCCEYGSEGEFTNFLESGLKIMMLIGQCSGFLNSENQTEPIWALLIAIKIKALGIHSKLERLSKQGKVTRD